MFLLGYDISSSSVKASLVDAETGKCVASAFFPKTEAGIIAVRPGWAEQEPESWWENLKLSTRSILSESRVDAKDIKAIGISYQMHGLVCVWTNGNAHCVRPLSGAIHVRSPTGRGHSRQSVRSSVWHICLILPETLLLQNWHG